MNINSEEFDWDDVPEDKLREIIPQLEKIGKAAQNGAKKAKAAWGRAHDGGDSEDCYQDGQSIATISMTKGTEGTYVVKDPLAYAAALHDIEAQLPGGKDAWETTNYPRPEAMRPDYLEALIRDHGGELPPGVDYKPGRPQTVMLRLDRHFAKAPLQARQLESTLKLLEGTTK